MVRNVKGEPSGSSSKANGVSRKNRGESDHNEGDDQNEGNGLERRVLRSRYLAVKNLISDKREEITKADSEKFRTIFDEVECLHQQVQKPREQVADAEALLDITNTLMTSVKAQTNEGVTASDFVSCLLKNFGEIGGGSNGDDEIRNSVRWKDIGIAVSHVFLKGDGCCTMLGPMNSEIKQRKVTVQRRQTKLTEKARPEEVKYSRDNLKCFTLMDHINTCAFCSILQLASSALEEKTDTDKNMSTMFDVLRKNRTVKLEALVLNRTSFAQTVENLFALSFLVKDGRAEIKVNDKGDHLVSPRNAPAANAVASKEVSYTHFLFRLDFKDWKLMMESVAGGDELMPHRIPVDTSPYSSQKVNENESVLPTTPIRKLSRNRGLVIQEETVVEDSPESGDSESRGGGIRKRRRKVR
ncbi:hypothetical protein LXL04_000413 [Taraxacum kok-saghyz]